MKQDVQTILKVTPPWLHVFEGDLEQLLNKVNDFSQQIFIYMLDGKRMRTQEEFYDELASELNFPSYFGRNLNALDECITDLDWLSINGPILLIIINAETLLVDAPIELFHGFVNLLENAGEEWSHCIETGEAWDRPGLPFNVVFQTGFDYIGKVNAKLNRCSVRLGKIK